MIASRRHLLTLALLTCLAANPSSVAPAGQLSVTSVSPAAQALTAPLDTPIVVNFSQPLNTATVNSASFRVFGRWTGPVSGAITFSNGNQTATLTPSRTFSAGDSVMVTLSHDIQAADSSPLRSAGYGFRFTTQASPATMDFNEIDTFDNCGDPCLQTRIYGAAATDLNNDGWLDLSTVNEVSSDLRVFMNLADGTGLYADFLPPEPLNFESSPNEPADFNNDGFADLCVASSATNVVSVLLGNGDGTFAPQQTISVGNQPHGIAVLDVEGDGDMDIATSNTNGNNCSLMLNNGLGVFGPSSSFSGGGNGEYSMGAGDMNNDGILDLVVGCRDSQTMVIHRGNGNGTFTNIFSGSCGGFTWMLTVADVNGDGNEDVLSANSGSNNGAVMLGNGAGGLSAPVTVAASGGPIATDVGDLDGDGDLDWLLSAFGGGIWRIFKNNGAGGFTFDQSFDAPSNPSCSIILDIDNDRDLDLCLTDEIADVVILMKNRGPLVNGDMNCDGLMDGQDIHAFVLALTAPASYASTFIHCEINNADVNDDSSINILDIAPFATLLTGG